MTSWHNSLKTLILPEGELVSFPVIIIIFFLTAVRVQSLRVSISSSTGTCYFLKNCLRVLDSFNGDHYNTDHKGNFDYFAIVV